MSDPASAPWGAVRASDVALLADVDPDNPDINDGTFMGGPAGAPFHVSRWELDLP